MGLARQAGSGKAGGPSGAGKPGRAGTAGKAGVDRVGRGPFDRVRGAGLDRYAHRGLRVRPADRRRPARSADGGWRSTRSTPAFRFPRAAARENADRLFARLPDEATVVVDGLAFGALAPEAERHAARLRFVALVHHPLAEETGLDRAVAASLEASERRALAVARLVVVTSPATARGLARYGVAASRVAVVVPGTDRAQPSSGSGSSTTALCVRRHADPAQGPRSPAACARGSQSPPMAPDVGWRPGPRSANPRQNPGAC